MVRAAAKLRFYANSRLIITIITVLYLTMGSQGQSSDYLSVVDSRTGRDYTIPITNNSVKAFDFGRITPHDAKLGPADQVDSGLKIFDRGFVNTACVESSITLM